MREGEATAFVFKYILIIQGRELTIDVPVTMIYYCDPKIRK